MREEHINMGGCYKNWFFHILNGILMPSIFKFETTFLRDVCRLEKLAHDASYENGASTIKEININDNKINVSL